MDGKGTEVRGSLGGESGILFVFPLLIFLYRFTFFQESGVHFPGTQSSIMLSFTHGSDHLCKLSLFLLL